MNDTIGKSVTKNDVPGDVSNLSGVSFFNVMFGGQKIQALKVLPDLPPYYSKQRDVVLSSSILNESYWSQAVSIAISKMASLAFDLDGPGRLVNQSQDLLHSTNGGRGWVNFIYKHLRDYLIRDNGSFVEIVRANKGSGSKIMGLVHLDSFNCTRTGNPDIPVIYKDRLGYEHEMKDYQILTLSDMPDSGQYYNDVGLCAASRAYTSIQKLAAIENYIVEKVTGSRPLAIYFLTGMNDKTLSAAIATNQKTQEARGAVVFGGAMIIPFIEKEGISVEKIPIAELPDGFNINEERSSCLLAYANALGLDPQDLQPLTGQALGTGAQSQVLHDKAGGKGLASWRQDFTHLLNELVLPEKVTFAFSEKDLRDEQAKATITNTRATAIAALVDKTIISSQQALQTLVDYGELDKSFLPQDMTPDITLSDTEKPEAEIEQPSPLPGPAPAPIPAPAPVQLPVATKTILVGAGLYQEQAPSSLQKFLLYANLLKGES